ncbi:trihelix transcription factor asil2 [Phtheirospermum japonicum]|uniref:Trihelix transcription factor asil2 n=1 Tax=Phtheirospermum japonicum TaxID=374723 RepID=A0A830CS71_9LAMI|nr:trihelix transcription factor asil2 [Phtheirospermum japonicum]
MASPSSSTPSPPPSLSPQPEPLLLPAPASKPVSPPKKTAPLPWTHPETLALIQAYQEKWYSVKRGPLKSFQWEEIAVTVAARCGFDEPSRTSTQCRHKMEKLRKRYRSDMQKPHPNSWQYFELMDQLERGPMPLTARPMAIVKSSSPNYANKSYNNDVNDSYGSFYPGSADYFKNNSNNNLGDGDGSDESDEEWNKGLETSKKNKSKGNNNNNNNIRRSDGKSSFRAAKTMNGKRKMYYDGDDSDEDEDDLVEEDNTGLDEEMEEGSERFMRMENKKIEMMRETERYWMEMEKKRMDMILENHRKIISSIGSAFGARKKANMADES